MGHGNLGSVGLLICKTRSNAAAEGRCIGSSFAGSAEDIRAIGAGRLGWSGQGISTKGVITSESAPHLDQPTRRD